MNNLASPVISTAFLCGENVCNTSTEAVELGPNAHVRITLEHSKVYCIRSETSVV